MKDLKCGHVSLSPAVELLRVLFPHQVEAACDGGILREKTEGTTLYGTPEKTLHISFVLSCSYRFDYHASDLWHKAALRERSQVGPAHPLPMCLTLDLGGRGERHRDHSQAQPLCDLSGQTGTPPGSRAAGAPHRRVHRFSVRAEMPDKKADVQEVPPFGFKSSFQSQRAAPSGRRAVRLSRAASPALGPEDVIRLSQIKQPLRP